jgi:hypothetical protein
MQDLAWTQLGDATTQLNVEERREFQSMMKCDSLFTYGPIHCPSLLRLPPGSLSYFHHLVNASSSQTQDMSEAFNRILCNEANYGGQSLLSLV